ncbi:MAG: hypothetical protein AAFQ64_03040 [Pseudomonadota bacterium]
MTEHVSDETLTAFLDGELSADESAAVESALTAQPALAQRLAQLDVVKDDIAMAFDEILPSAPTMPDLPSASPRAKSASPFMGLAAAAAVGAIIGFGATFGTSAPSAPDWKEAIANYQVLYVPETLATATGQDQAERLETFSERLGLPLKEATIVDGLTFRRVQMLGFEAAPLVQMAYVSPDGAPFAFCITEVGEADYAPKTENLSGLAAAHWVEDGIGYLIIGGDDLDFVNGLAATLATKV